MKKLSCVLAAAIFSVAAVSAEHSLGIYEGYSSGALVSNWNSDPVASLWTGAELSLFYACRFWGGLTISPEFTLSCGMDAQATVPAEAPTSPEDVLFRIGAGLSFGGALGLGYSKGHFSFLLYPVEYTRKYIFEKDVPYESGSGLTMYSSGLRFKWAWNLGPKDDPATRLGFYVGLSYPWKFECQDYDPKSAGITARTGIVLDWLF